MVNLIEQHIPVKKFLGCVLIVAGSALGGGMLALPLVSAQSGFAVTTLLLLLFWAIMTLSALCVLEVCLACNERYNSFGTMAKSTLGRFGKLVTTICFLCLLYSTLSAYLAGGSTLIAGLLLYINIQLPMWLNTSLFTLIFAYIIFCGTKYVDYFMRFFLLGKGFLFIILMSLLLPKVELKLIRHLPDVWHSVSLLIPIIMTAFGCHFVIPSIRLYVGNKPKSLHLIVILGTSLPLLVYFIWILVTLGLIPLYGLNSYTAITQHHWSVNEFIGSLIRISNSSIVAWVSNLFVNIAITTSFFGVSLGLFDFLAELFQRKDHILGRLQTCVLTFSLPFIFAVFYPDGFVLALVYSAIFGALLELVLPVLMVLSLRRRQSNTLTLNTAYASTDYRAPVNNIILFGLLVIGIIVIILAFNGVTR
ncbi:MAG: tyrosine-specific transport protein [Pseudomonadota bacterium]|nr:tyrosine-specific transport protein [Pseudomonadota bacterium]